MASNTGLGFEKKAKHDAFRFRLNLYGFLYTKASQLAKSSKIPLSLATLRLGGDLLAAKSKVREILGIKRLFTVCHSIDAHLGNERPIRTLGTGTRLVGNSTSPGLKRNG